MARNKSDNNQLDLLKELAEAEKSSAPVLPEIAPEESAADKAFREIFKKLDEAEQNKKRKEEDKLVSISLKNIRAEIKPEQSDKTKGTKEAKDDEAFKPGDEYYGRFNKFRK